MSADKLHSLSSSDSDERIEARQSANRKATREGFAIIDHPQRVSVVHSNGERSADWEVVGVRNSADDGPECYLWRPHPTKPGHIQFRIEPGAAVWVSPEGGNRLDRPEPSAPPAVGAITDEVRRLVGNDLVSDDDVLPYKLYLEGLNVEELDAELVRLREIADVARRLTAEAPGYEEYREACGDAALSRADVESLRSSVEMAGDLCDRFAELAGNPDNVRGQGAAGSARLVAEYAQERAGLRLLRAQLDRFLGEGTAR